MDLINNRTKSIGEMALNGLYERSKAISANTVNVLTPNYQRKEVSFEQSLLRVIQREDEKEQIRAYNSQAYKNRPNEIMQGQSPAQIAFLNSQANENYFIDVETDMSEPLGMDGNNVNIEEEMMAEARTGMQYQTVASLLSKSYSQLENVIRGQNG